ncbi:MAG: M42 family peptidase, partial [Cyanobacteria bacterium J06631_9]
MGDVSEESRWTDDTFFEVISELVMCHSPSGVETEVNEYLLARLAALGVNHWQDAADNIVIKIAGGNSEDFFSAEESPEIPKGAIAITAHKDEIGGIVKRLGPNGKVSVRALGGAYPWVYGEGIVDLLGDYETVSGVLSFGSRHVSHESPQKALQEGKSVEWQNAWVETKLSNHALDRAGVRPGTRVVVGKHRKQPFRLGSHIASY